MHWQVRAAGGDPCSRAPGPTDWRYQGVVRLQPEDVRDLMSGYEWQPVATRPSPQASAAEPPYQAWPGLAPFVTGDGWQQSPGYASANLAGERQGELYLNPAHGLAFFVLHGS